MSSTAARVHGPQRTSPRAVYIPILCRSADIAVGQALAGHVVVIMTAERDINQLGLALHSRTIIGQAQGILMARLKVSADQAFACLRRLSSHTNRTLAQVADDIATTGRLPHLE